MPSATAPTRTGYTFGGYYTSSGGAGTQYYNASMGSAKNWDKTTNTKLYAKWTAKSYNVTFKGGNQTTTGCGFLSDVTETITYGGTLSYTPRIDSDCTLQSVSCTNGYAVRINGSIIKVDNNNKDIDTVCTFTATNRYY